MVWGRLLFFSQHILSTVMLTSPPKLLLWAPGKYGHLNVSYTPQTSEPPLFYSSPAIPKPIHINNLNPDSSCKSSQLPKQKSWVFLSFSFSSSSHRMFHLSHQHDWNGLPVISAWAHDNPFSATVCRAIFKTFNFEIMADLPETANTVQRSPHIPFTPFPPTVVSCMTTVNTKTRKLTMA